MTNQEIFEILSNLEEETFYKSVKEKTVENKAIHDTIKETLERFAKITGCHN